MIIGICGLAGSGKDTFATYLGRHGAVNVAMADPLKRIARDVYAFTRDQLWGPSHMRNTPDKRYPRAHTWVLADRTADQEMVCSCCGAEAGRRFVEDDVLVVNEEDVPRCHLTPRYALQMLGTEWGRTCYPDTWAALCVRTAKKLLESTMEDSPKNVGWHSLYYTAENGLWDGENVRQVTTVTVSDVRFRNEMQVIRQAGGKVIRVVRPGAGLKGAAGTHPSEVEQAGILDREFDAVIENVGDLEALQAKALPLLERIGVKRVP